MNLIGILLALIVFVIALKVIGKLLGLAIGIGLAVLVYIVAEKLIGKGR
ncbi:MAG: hypothetical protein AB7E60_14100 [Sphingobium sp.]